MSNPNDFIIENGVLTKYTGPGGDVVIPEGVTKIGNWAFNSCMRLTSVNIPKSVTVIGRQAFSDCGLMSVTIPENVREIGESAFRSCCRLKCVTLPKNVTKIGDLAFGNCEGLKNVTILGRVEKIEKHIFEDIKPVIAAPHIFIGDFAPVNRPSAACGFAKLYMEKTELNKELCPGISSTSRARKNGFIPLPSNTRTCCSSCLRKK